MHLTSDDARVEGADAHFPRFDPAGLRELSREAHAADARNDFAFEFADYERDYQRLRR
jgi:dihydrofolate reductase